MKAFLILLLLSISALADIITPASPATAGTDTVITLTARATGVYRINAVIWSYSGSATIPSATVIGEIVITVGGVTVSDTDVTNSGTGFLLLSSGAVTGQNKAVVITLKNPSGGTGVTGKLTVVADAL